MSIEKMYKVPEVAEILGVTPRTVFRYMEEGRTHRLKSVKFGKQQLRIKESDLQAFISGYETLNAVDNDNESKDNE